MDTPNFLEMTAGDIEKWHRKADLEVVALRAQMLTAHDILAIKHHEERRRELAARPGEFPAEQTFQVPTLFDFGARSDDDLRTLRDKLNERLGDK